MAVQRWRLVLARDADAPPATQRELAQAWEDAIVEGGLPVLRADGATGRPRIAFGAPLPVGMAAEGELIDVLCTERWPVWRVRAAIAPRVPVGWRLLDVHDIWPGAPALAGRVAAADYRVALSPGSGADAASLEAACRRLLASPSIERDRPKGGSTLRYDLRPLLVALRVGDPGPPPVLAIRTRIHPELGNGRPEEVVAALGSALGTELAIAAIVRERLVLAEDLAAEG